MYNRKNWIAVIIVILGIAIFIPFAQAQRQEFENIWCGAATYNVMQFSKEISAMSGDAKGILRSTHESKLFDNWTTHSISVIKGQDGKWFWNGLGKRMAPDGEFIIMELSGNSEVGGNVKFIYGTGKWSGIKGEFKVKRLTTGKPITQGTEQHCERHEGWFELPK